MGETPRMVHNLEGFVRKMADSTIEAEYDALIAALREEHAQVDAWIERVEALSDASKLEDRLTEAREDNERLRDALEYARTIVADSVNADPLRADERFDGKVLRKVDAALGGGEEKG